MERDEIKRALKREEIASNKLDSLIAENDKFSNEHTKQTNNLYKKEVKLEELRRKMERADREQRAKEMQALQQRMHLDAVSANKSKAEVAELKKILSIKEKEILNSNKHFVKIKKKLNTSYDSYNKTSSKRFRRNFEDMKNIQIEQMTAPRSPYDTTQFRSEQRSMDMERRRPIDTYERKYERRSNYEHHSFDGIDNRSTRRPAPQPGPSSYGISDFEAEIRQAETRLVGLRKLEKAEQERNRKDTYILKMKRDDLVKRRAELDREEENITRMINMKDIRY